MKTIRDILFLSLFSVSVFYFWWDTDQTAITNSEVPMLIFNITFRSAFVTIIGVIILNLLLKSFAYKEVKDPLDLKTTPNKDQEDKDEDEKGTEDIEIKLFIYSMIIASFASYFFTSLWIWTQYNAKTMHIRTLLVGQLFIFYLIFFLFLWT